MRKILIISSMLLSTLSQANVSSVHDFSQLQQEEALAQAELSIKTVQAQIVAENAKINHPTGSTIGTSSQGDEQGPRPVLVALTGSDHHYTGIISLNNNSYRITEGASVGPWHVIAISAQGIDLKNNQTHCQVRLHPNGTDTYHCRGDKHV